MDDIRNRINAQAGRRHELSRAILGIDWYDTESQARSVIEHIAEREFTKTAVAEMGPSAYERLTAELAQAGWAPCSPELLDSGVCCATAPRIPGAPGSGISHYHPAPAQDEREAFEACDSMLMTGEICNQHKGHDGPCGPSEWLTRPAQTEQYIIGDLTNEKVFKVAGLTNLSDMQAVLNAVEAALGQTEPAPAHDLYRTGDEMAPDAIKDRNGEVVLDLCKRCGQGEAELAATCPAKAEPAPAPEGNEWVLLPIAHGSQSEVKADNLQQAVTLLDFGLAFALCNTDHGGTRRDVKKAQQHLEEVKAFLSAELESRPTPDAYDAACKALWKNRDRVAELEQLIKRIVDHAKRDRDNERHGAPNHCHRVRNHWDTDGSLCQECVDWDQLRAFAAEAPDLAHMQPGVPVPISSVPGLREYVTRGLADGTLTLGGAITATGGAAE
ncbi:hypothetical protein [Stutzerimonas nitrititolerans]|uniref:hypothetical protein n=1 Tax=Stutzerimonas nitrititolerans TaxID=2482751 RepID=UPI00289F9E9E|nr:hypothetical protein [Stutzerimonas nitrititolerans]